MVSHSGCATLLSLQQNEGPSVFTPSRRVSVFVCLTAILTGVRWHFTVVLICIFLMLSGAEHLFICFLAIFVYLGKYLLSPLPTFTLDCLSFYF